MTYEKHNWESAEIISASKMNNIENGIFELSSQSLDKNSLIYKMVSLTLNIDKEIDSDCFDKISNNNATISLIVMCSINNANDPNPIAQPSDRIQNTINVAKAHNANITMLKPHIGKYDSFDRYTYNPSDYQSFFNNWTNQMLEYARICDTNHIPILSIGCEQYLTTASKYTQNWMDMISKIKNAYPNIKIIYSMSRPEFTSMEHWGILPYLDFIGLNVYPSYTDMPYSNDFSIYDLIGGWYQSRTSGIDFQSIIDTMTEKYNKQILLTEIGGMPYVNVLNSTYIGDGHYNIFYDALAKFISVSFYIAKKNKNIVGLAWWHGEFDGTFSLWEKNNITSSESQLKIEIEGA